MHTGTRTQALLIALVSLLECTRGSSYRQLDSKLHRIAADGRKPTGTVRWVGAPTEQPDADYTVNPHCKRSQV